MNYTQANHQHGHHNRQSNQPRSLYTCPMHPEVTADKPGFCPKCHMALEKTKQAVNHAYSHNHHDKHAGHNPNMFKQKFWLSLALTVPTLIFSPSVQGWFELNFAFTGIEYIPAVLGTIIFIYGGLVFLKSAKAELAARQPGMMTLISLAISVAFAYSLAVTIKLVNGMDFWWELATLVTIMLLGHWVEMASIQSAQGALGELAKLLPDTAELVHGNHIMKVPVSELKIDDQILIRPGAQVPADGKVRKGKSDVNESMLTGESKPVTKSAGQPVIGGTINGSGSLTVAVTKVGGNTALAGIMKLVADAQASKSNIQVLADKAAGYLTYFALAAAIITWLAWWAAGAEASFILERVVTVLVVACPHALGLAIPLVAAISTKLAAKNGLLVRQRAALESARNLNVVLFDKTGTLTKGEQGVTNIIGSDPAKALAITAALEQDSEHPVARAITKYASANKTPKLNITDFSALPGRGVRAKIDGTYAYAGGPQMMKELGVKIDKALLNATQKASNDGKTVVFAVENKSILGAIILDDVIREESRTAVAALHSMGKRVAILTGDNKGGSKVGGWRTRHKRILCGSITTR